MPIKFRCQHCRQFLGIARSKAGAITDCPTCGRSIRVPNLDGTVSPMPQPKIDPNDADLADAFQALADIGDAETLPSEPPVITSDEPTGETMAPQPIAEFKPAPAPVVVEAPVAAPSAPTPPKPQSAEPPPPSVDHASELADLARQPASANEQPRVRQSHNTKPASAFSLTSILTGVAMLVVGIGIGYGFGSFNRSPSTDTIDNGGPDRSENENVSNEYAVAVEGRVTYRDETGQSKPDSGARILIFPSERKGELKLTSVGFRSGDTVEDFRIGEAAFIQMGGATTLTNDEGRFEVTLPDAGDYQILVLSRFATQPEDAPVDTDLQRTLAKYFQKPAELLGQVGHTFGQLRYNGSEPTTWDHSFSNE